MPKPKKSGQAKRPVKYETVSANLARGDDAITAQQAKDLLGWQEETDGVKFGPDFLLQDVEGRKVRCTYNVTNRPLYQAVLDTLKQEILNKRWRFNGEPIIIGRTGLILNGQHTLIALVLAEQERLGKNKHHWADYWKGPVKIEKMIVYGVDEGDATVNTMDTCKPRSLADVIYRSEYFASLKGSERRAAARATDYAVRMMWHRTGAGLDAFAPRRTHAESLDFVGRHPGLLKAVRHLMEEEAGSKGGVSRLLSLGYASALLYLMAASEDDVDVYRHADPPSEKAIYLSRWDKACEYWVGLAAGSNDLQEVKYALGALSTDGAGGTLPERIGTLILGWNCWLREGPLTPISRAGLVLPYGRDADGARYLAGMPELGGIDLGDPSFKDGHDEDSNGTQPDPGPDELERRKEAERVAREKRENGRKANGKRTAAELAAELQRRRADGTTEAEGAGKAARPKHPKPVRKGKGPAATPQEPQDGQAEANGQAATDEGLESLQAEPGSGEG